MRYVVLCSFDNYIDANLLLGRLQEEGINCWLQDEHTVTIDPIVSNAIGGIKLMVYFSQAERARDLIESWKPRPATQCPACGAVQAAMPANTDGPPGWLNRLLHFVTGKQHEPPATGRVCSHCGTALTAPDNE